MGPERRVGTQPPPDLGGQGISQEGPEVEVHALPDLCPHGIPRRRLTQAGGRQALAGEEMP